MQFRIERIGRVFFIVSFLATAAGCVGGAEEASAGPSDWRQYDACAPLRMAIEPGATDVQTAAVAAGLAFWNERAATHIMLMGGEESFDLALRFQKASLASLGYYDPNAAMIFINAGITDPHDLAVTVAHETGHALGLPHVAASERSSVMNPGNRTVEPTRDDIATLAAIWGVCPR